MTPTLPSEPIHPQQTRRSRYSYQFTAKHHGHEFADAARWSLAVSRDIEFSVFDSADFHDLSDERNWLYGVLRAGEHGLHDLGTWGQQVAAFPFASEGQPWHGYPLWPLSDQGPENRKGEKCRPAIIVFQKMEQAGLITHRERRRLLKGDHV